MALDGCPNQINFLVLGQKHISMGWINNILAGEPSEHPLYREIMECHYVLMGKWEGFGSSEMQN